MKIRLHTIDTATGSECTVDADIASLLDLNAQDIADALAEHEQQHNDVAASYEGLFLQKGGPESDQPGSGAFVVRVTNDVAFGEYLIAGTVYTVFDQPVKLGERLMPGCTCGAAAAGNFDRCSCD